MSDTDTSSVISHSYCRRSKAPGTARQVHTAVLSSPSNSSTSTTAAAAIFKGLPPQQVSLPCSGAAAPGACLSKSSSCPDSPIRRVSSSLRSSAVGFATRFFNKCRAATFTVDGATYTIVASTPENLPKRDDLSCLGGNNSTAGCHTQQTASCSLQQSSSAGDKASFTNTQSYVTAGSGGGGGTGTGVCPSAANASLTAGSCGGTYSRRDFPIITSPSAVDNTHDKNICSNNLITCNNSASALNGQVARHGALTIVRRSNSRKSFIQQESSSAINSPAPSSSIQQNLLGDLTVKSSHENRTKDFSHSGSSPSTTLSHSISVTSANSDSVKIYSNNNGSSKTTSAQNLMKMLPTSPNPTNLLVETADEMESSREDLVPSRASGSITNSSAIDLATDNLPAVDTPDACDKAALRLRSLLHMLNNGEIQADVLQKNLHYAARVLEAVFLDESNQSNKRETKGQSCNGACKNVVCNQHDHTTHSTLDPDVAVSNDNNNLNNMCCMLGNVVEGSGTSGEDSSTQVQNASSNQAIIESRTKGVSSAPQTHSGPTGPPVDKDNPCKDSIIEEDGTRKQTCSSSSQVTMENDSISSVSSSSKATIQRQKRLRTPIWARSMSTNKTYITFFVIIMFDLN